MSTTLSSGRVAELAAGAGCDAAEVVAIVDEECAPYIRLGAQPPIGWLETGEVGAVARWVADKSRSRTITVHRHGMAIGEFSEDGRTVYVPAWANGSLDAHSIADTPRFASLDEAKAAVDAEFARVQAEREAAARQRATRPVPSQAERERLILAASLAAQPEYDPAVCWECGCPITDGDGILDDPMGYAHRSCVGA